MNTADVLVVGLGAVGSATVHKLTKLGADVVGIDQFRPPHQRGSSSGGTRITRRAVGEGDTYAPFAIRSHELWREIEAETGAAILTECGALVLSDGGGSVHGTDDFVVTTAAIASRFGVEHELLSAADISHRYPQLRIGADFTGCFEPGGGFVHTETAIGGQLELARRRGAILRYGERVLDISSARDGVTVRTDASTYQAGQVVVSAGAWLPSLLRGTEIATRFQVYRQVMYWFDTDTPAAFDPARFPVFLWPFGDGEFFYGFPAIDGDSGGVKVATDDFTATTTADELDRKVAADEPGRMHAHCVARRIPGLSNRVARQAVCMFTVAPGFGFVIDRHPEQSNTWLVSACSGHGFKHSAAIGEAVAQRVLTGHSDLSLSPFALRPTGR